MFVLVKQPCEESAVAAKYALAEVDSYPERGMQLSMQVIAVSNNHKWRKQMAIWRGIDR